MNPHELVSLRSLSLFLFSLYAVIAAVQFPGIRNHMQKNIGDVYGGMDLTCEYFPGDDEVDPKAYVAAAATFKKGDVAIIFTPDDTHYDIAMECVKRGMHVMVTKPIVQYLDHHIELAKAAAENNVLVAVEVHKRLDPFYADARDRARSSAFGDFQYMYAYMSQPKHQLETFKVGQQASRMKIGREELESRFCSDSSRTISLFFHFIFIPLL